MTTPVNAAQARVRSMKARRAGKCRCGRLTRVGDRITRHNGQWLCTECAITTAIAIAQATYERRPGGMTDTP